MPPPKRVSFVVDEERESLAQNEEMVACSEPATAAAAHQNVPEDTSLSVAQAGISVGRLDMGPSKRRDEDSWRVKMRMRLKKLAVFWPVKVAQLLCVVYILVLTFSKAPIGLVDPSSGNIIDVNSAENTANGVILVNGDYRPVVAEGSWQKFFLAMSRMSAFSMYPALVLVFLTKCKATHSVLSKTPLSMFLILHESHELHVYAGQYIAVDAWIHTYFHLLRWIEQNNTSLLWKSRTGLSGLIVLIGTPFITVAMMFCKTSIRYEIRKALHYLFFLFAIGLCFHVPTSGLPNGGFIAYVMGICICLYTVDATYVFLFMTEKIETTTFHVLSSGVRITMAVSESFQKRGESGGIAYVCLPWVDRLQWHAFSLFEDPTEPDKRQIFMMNTGDWTQAVHRALQRDTVRPLWVQGPFPSPYSQAGMYDNQILVASGIGITPALSVIRAHKSSRRINLIWAVRDPAMLEFFTEHMYLDHDGWNLIFYTGKEPLVPALEEMNTNVRVIKGRPDLKIVIPNIIYGIESSVGLPETYTSSEMLRMKELLIERMRDLDSMDDISSKEKLAELTAFANSRGFVFTELINDMKKQNKKQRSMKSLDVTAAREVTGSRKHTEMADSSAYSGDANGSSTSDRMKFRASTVLHQIREYGEHEFPQQKENADVSRRSLLDHAAPISQHDIDDSATLAGWRDSFANRGRMQSIHGKRFMWLKQNLTTNMSDRSVTKALTSTFKPWEKNDIACDYIKDLDEEQVLATWGILYCGGSPPVQKALKQISAEYHLSLNMESFAW